MYLVRMPIPTEYNDKIGDEVLVCSLSEQGRETSLGDIRAEAHVRGIKESCNKIVIRYPVSFPESELEALAYDLTENSHLKVYFDSY